MIRAVVFLILLLAPTIASAREFPATTVQGIRCTQSVAYCQCVIRWVASQPPDIRLSHETLVRGNAACRQYPHNDPLKILRKEYERRMRQ